MVRQALAWFPFVMRLAASGSTGATIYPALSVLGQPALAIRDRQ